MNIQSFASTILLINCLILSCSAKLPRPPSIDVRNVVESEDYMNDIGAVDNRIFSKKGNEAVKQLWEYVSNKLSYVEERIENVESQTSELLERLSTVDCSSLPKEASSGVYSLYLDHRGRRAVRAYCDQDTAGGGWTVILRRVPHQDAADALNFTREYRDYKIGFGDPEGDFWVGLENLHLWTNYRNYQLRVVLKDFDNRLAYAQYDDFYVENEREGYRLRVSGYEGDAGDSLGGSDNFTADGMMFSTHDEDRDTSREINCSRYWDIGGWWFNRCSWANLMGPYKLPGSGTGIGINWHKWRNMEYLKAATMMIRFKP